MGLKVGFPSFLLAKGYEIKCFHVTVDIEDPLSAKI